MTIIEEIARKYEKDMNEVYARANTKSKRKVIARDLISFNEICSSFFDIPKVYDWNKDSNLISLIKNPNVPFIEHVVNNASVYSRIFGSVLGSFIENKFETYKYYGKNYQRLSNEEMKELVFSFLNNYDQELLKDFKSKLENSEIFYSDIEGYKGLTYSFGSLNKNLIFYSAIYGDCIDCVNTIVHEFGHSFEMSTFYSVGKKNYLDIVFPKPYYEISSRFFEYAFLNYLKENNILVDDVNKRLHTYFYDLLIRGHQINLVYQMDQVDIDEFNNVSINDNKVLEYSRMIEEKLNCELFTPEDGDTINIRHAFLYGIGSLFAVYLYENYKEDPNNFKKEFKNALLSSPYINSIDAFEKVGINPEKLIRGDALKRVLKNSR